jgi:predicted RNA-binding protein Jag
MNKSIISEGKTRQEAIDNGLKQLKVSRGAAQNVSVSIILLARI